MKELFQINRETCIKDGACREVCPVHVIEIKAGGYPAPAAGAENICVRCGHCVAVCPTGSFSHRDMGPEGCPPVRQALLPSPHQVEHLLQCRRSIRVYKEAPVGREVLEKLIAMAGWAPSAHNSRKVNWMVFGGSEKLRKLAAVVVDWMRWTMEVLPDRAAEYNFERRVKQWAAGTDGILRGAPVLVVVHGGKEAALPPEVVTGMDNLVAPMDYAIALSQLELAAASLGLGACWAGYVYKAANLYPPMHEVLGLPEGHQCYGAMMVGYSKFSYRRIPQRSAPVITWRM